MPVLASTLIRFTSPDPALLAASWSRSLRWSCAPSQQQGLGISASRCYAILANSGMTMRPAPEAAARRLRRHLPWSDLCRRLSVSQTGTQGSVQARPAASSVVRRRAWGYVGPKPRKGLGEVRRSYSSNTTIASDLGSLGSLQKSETSTLLKDPQRPVVPESAISSGPGTAIEGHVAVQQIRKDIATDSVAPDFWSHKLQKSPEGKDIVVHYCRTLKSSEDVAQLFLEDDIIGLDLEWKASASAWDGIQGNVSMIQIANRHRVALFHVALFRPARGLADLVPPTLKRIIEDPAITKAGVSIKADCTRLRKYLQIDARGIFELSHLHKLVKYCQSNPKLINKRLVNLSEQVEEHFGLPLCKDEVVRCGEWTAALNYRQVQYAASDPYACVCLFDAMNAKRQALEPTPPLPAHAELNIPIRTICDAPVTADLEEIEVVQSEETPENPKDAI
ncbi:3'-5' exonuclease [Aspergillus homomorphus CBS 101889]|uniref:Ribonuclease H-like protein n=1 Tax=Aspergillus homomorphus (strain CBS 101889) TaxID=1450537 RepID=A0A395I684_ASPHC|nr:ribonuclease H-like protein [Aspergillus homomorphus CBS 101889]RAL15630.1 ribonuclease H-like protein [Aspergillus homomorphus CBS 101889]